MNATTRADLDTIPIPVENGSAVMAKVTSLPDGSWSLAWTIDGGLRVEPFGEPFADVRKACHAAAAINAKGQA